MVVGALYALIAVGFTLSYGVGKFFNLAHGVMTAIGAYAVFTLSKGLQVNVWFAIVFALVFTGVVGWLLERFIYAPLRAQEGIKIGAISCLIRGAFTALQGTSFHYLFFTDSNLVARVCWCSRCLLFLVRR